MRCLGGRLSRGIIGASALWYADVNMLNADTVTFRELMRQEPLPLSTIQNAVLEFLRGRHDVVLFGAQAVNAYVANL